MLAKVVCTDTNRFNLLSQTLKKGGYQLVDQAEVALPVDLLVVSGLASLENLDSKSALWLDLPDREELGQPENKLRLISKADFISCSKPEDRPYYFAWLVQAGKVSNDDRIAILSQDSSELDSSLNQFLEKPSKLVSSGISYGQIYERAFQKSTLKGGQWQDFSQQELVSSFYMPHDNTQRLGLGFNFDCRLSLRQDGKLIASEQKKQVQSEQALHWLAIPKTKNIKGGSLLELKVEKLSASEPGDQLCFQASDSNLGPELLFLADEMDSFWRGLVLAKRGLSMLKNGEWSRFSHALKRRLPEACKQVLG